MNRILNKNLVLYMNNLKFNGNVYNLRRCHTQKPVMKTSELTITDLLRKRFPNAKSILVEDTSGGCGQMFSVLVESDDFKNLSVLKQHKMVYDTLDNEIKIAHGLHLTTRIPDK